MHRFLAADRGSRSPEKTILPEGKCNLKQSTGGEFHNALAHRQGQARIQ